MKAVLLALALMVSGCTLVQPVHQMTEREWSIVVTVFQKDGSTEQSRYTYSAVDVYDCMDKAREYGNAVRNETNTVSIMCNLG